MIDLYCTKSRSKKPLVAQDGKTLKMYTCGPTVYNCAHIGNLRTFLFEDILRRTLLYFGQDVNHVMNITDVDDKTIKGALENNQTLSEFTKPFEEAFYSDCKTLNILPATAYTKATDHIDAMIALIQKLLDQNIAYQGSDGNVFFSIAKFPSYGCLSHLKLDELKTGASERTASDEYDKNSLSDFVLWKAYDEKRDGPIFWDSPFGKGRPGWHIECSAMAIDALGPTLDLHCGGVDNIFPHHENEIAQSESATQKPFANHWSHAEHLIVDGKKMSKSLGNFYRLQDLLDKGYSGEEIRYTLLSTHYRTQLNFTLDGLDASRQSLARFTAFFERLRDCDGQSHPELASLIENTTKTFDNALKDDLNISIALATLFDALRSINTWIDQNQISSENAKSILDAFTSFDKVIGCLPLTSKTLDIPPELLDALQKRQQARKAKDFANADKYRDQILNAGYIIEDSPKGPILRKK